MIEITALTKQFPGAARPAVDHLTLTIPEGELCVLIGPSGCGKTTTMRIINRMIEPDSGTVLVGGRNIMSVDRVELRRSIGYVIQQIGLFPHWTIADNVATVPRLLKWDEARVARRVDELLALVGMDPATYRDRFPRALSGGQRQRIGVARALAADPPVMLMDEPFGALDPITRARLQHELLRIQHELRKTIVFVTHDIDEAILLGDRIAILREGGVLAQYDTPEALLARPADEFVSRFLGSDRGLKLLALRRLDELDLAPLDGAAGPTADGSTTLRDALSQMITAGTRSLVVLDGAGQPRGVVTMESLTDVAA